MTDRKHPTPRLNEAENEARRFLLRVDYMRHRMRKLKIEHDQDPPSIIFPWHPQDHAAVKRSSLDLSAALVALRREGA